LGEKFAIFAVIVEFVVILFANRLLVKTFPVERDMVEPLNVPPGAAPFMLLILRARLERIWKRPVPITSKVVAGDAVPIPTFEVEPAIYREGVASCVVEGHERAGAPTSKTIFPVVCRRIWSVVDDTL
jgi:hypothetical protein